MLRLTSSLSLRLFFAFAALVTAARAAEVLTNAGLDPERLRFGSISIYSENDKYFAGTDQHYTNGVKVSFLSTDLSSFTTDPVPKPVQEIARTLGSLVPPGRDVKLGLSFGQNIYTPIDTRTTAPQPLDRPYAAWLYGGVAFEVYQPPRIFATGSGAVARLDTLEITAGMVGPLAFGQQVQNNYHHLIGVKTAKGWDNQINNEPGLNFVYERKWRYSTKDSRDGFGADFIPHAGFSLGNIFTYANTGFEVRSGWRMPADFGTNLIRPSGDSNSARRAPFSMFVFFAVDGRAIAHDVTLDGNTFRDSASVDRTPFVADLTGGLAVGTRHWQVTYTQASRTREFSTQTKASVFGSISVTFFY
jgi:hypothetical protein